MAENKPFKVDRSTLPPNARTLFNPENCFAKGELVPGESGKPVLAGKCQVVQFGKNHTGNNCMFVCQTDFSEVFQRERSVLASFVFDHQGRVIDLYFGNSAATPSWRTHVDDGTRASFGYLPPPTQSSSIRGYSDLSPAEKAEVDAIHETLKTTGSKMTQGERMELLEKKSKIMNPVRLEPKKAKDWGCTRVLKGPFDVVGCQRQHSASLVEGFPFVSCVEVHADFDQKWRMSPEDERKIQPYFEYIPLTKMFRQGSSAREYYDMETLGNTFGSPGYDSFVVLSSNGTISPIETRTDQRPRPIPIPLRLSVSNPETRKKFELELKKGHESVRSEMGALEWLEMHPLVFPGGPIDETFADRAFGWVHELSMQFKAPAVSLSSDDLVRMMESSLSRQTGLKDSAKASTPAMFSPAMRESIFAAMATQPRLAKQVATSCKCTPTKHDPMCRNQFCPVRYARVSRFRFEWPRLRIESGPPELVIMLADQIVANQEKERTKKLAAEVAEATRVKDAAAKKVAEDAKRERKNELARQATALRKKAAEEAKASGVPTAPLRGRRATAALVAPLASAEPVESSLGASALGASALGASAASDVAPARGRKRVPESAAPAAPASAAPASAGPAAPASAASRKKRKGGSKSKSKRRVRK